MGMPCQIWRGLCTPYLLPSPTSLRFVISVHPRIRRYKSKGFYFIQVGKETIHSSDDAILKQDMPASLHRVEGAARLLEEASSMLKADPYSGPARYVGYDVITNFHFIMPRLRKQEEVD